MKTFLVFAVSLILGLGLGYGFGQHRAEREKTDTVRQMVDRGESSDRMHALMAARVIQLLEAGQPGQAEKTLAFPIAHYYAVYTEPGTKEEGRAETRALIEELAKTNQVVAVRIAEFSTNAAPQTP